MVGYYDTEYDRQKKSKVDTILPILAAIEAVGTSISSKGQNVTGNTLNLWRDVESRKADALDRAMKRDQIKRAEDLQIGETARASKRLGLEEAAFQSQEDKGHRDLIAKEKAIARMLGTPTTTDEATNTVTLGRKGIPDLTELDKVAIETDPMGWLANKLKPQGVSILPGLDAFYTIPKTGGPATRVTTAEGGTPTPKPPSSGETKAPAGYRWGAAGDLEAIPGGPADPKTKVDTKPATEDQSKAANFARRMELALSDIAEIEATGFNRASAEASVRSGAFTPNFLNSKEGQRYSNAEKNFASANLRKESGAVIGRDEMLQQEQLYFPRHGDTPETIAQKARNRAQAYEGMKAAAGVHFDKIPSMVPQKAAKTVWRKAGNGVEYEYDAATKQPTGRSR